MSKSKHAILVIKNIKGEYLQYYDDRWNCYLFLNCKLQDDGYEESIKECLLNRFGLCDKNVKVKYEFEKIHSKYSESAKTIKDYHHYFYSIQNLNLEYMNEKEFVYNGIKFLWLSMNELQENKRIQEVNKDIVDFVKEIKI